MPKISIIVPVYKVEQYLDRCVESILAQTFTDFELILVDDGSPDNCPQMCDEWAKKDCRIVVIHKPNEGVSIARNAALDIAKGEYIAFCDSDDYWGTNYLKNMYDAMVSSNADMVVSKYTTFYENGDIKEDAVLKHAIGITKIPTKEERIRYLYTYDRLHGWEVWTRLFKKSIIDTHQIRFPTTCKNYAEDMGFVLAYNLYANVIQSIDNLEYFYMIRFGSMMRNSKNVIKVDEMNEVSKWFYQKYIDVFNSKKQKLAYAIMHFLILRVEYIRLVGTEKYQYLRKYLDTINDIKWFNKQTKNIKKCKKMLEQQYGERISKQILLLSRYCYHKNWNRFKIESAIAYRWFIKGE